MSAFLGKIHHWLYQKILLQESLIDSIAAMADAKDYDIESLLAESREKYGEPVTGALEDIIEHTNIHGWLQEKIHSVEKRLAYVITELLNQNVLTTEEFALAFTHQGSKAGEASISPESKPQELYTLIYDHLLEGMPCDHAHEILESDAEGITWEARRCLHQDHWDAAGGDISIFYELRDHWIDGFIRKTGFRYTRETGGISSIRKE